MKIDLSGKRALVTAGAAGIGQVIAQHLADCGAKVAICDIAQESLDSYVRIRPDTLAIKGDVAAPKDVDRLFDAIEEHMGGLDILINNAGVSGPTKPVENIDPEEWSHTLDVNVGGAFLCARRAAPGFKAQKSGVIINISSSAGRMCMPLRSPYSASKYAIRGLSDTLAIELGEHGVRVNSVLPGFVDGERGQRVIAEQAAAKGMSYEKYLPYFLHNISLHTAVSQQDVAALVTFLASDFARNISGQSIGVCGNFESYRAPMMLQQAQ